MESNTDDFSICLGPFDLLLSTEPLYFADNFVPESTDFRSSDGDQHFGAEIRDVTSSEDSGCSRCSCSSSNSSNKTNNNNNNRNNNSCNCRKSANFFVESDSEDKALPRIEINGCDYDSGREKERILEQNSRLHSSTYSHMERSLRTTSSTENLMQRGSIYAKKNDASPKKTAYRYGNNTNHSSSVSTTASDVTDDVREICSQSSSSASSGRRGRRRPFRFILRRVVRNEKRRLQPPTFTRLDSSATESIPGSAPVSRNPSAVHINPSGSSRRNPSENSKSFRKAAVKYGSENTAIELEWHEEDVQRNLEQRSNIEQDLQTNSRAAFVVVHIDDDDDNGDDPNRVTGTISGTEIVSSNESVTVSTSETETYSSNDTGISSVVDSGVQDSSPAKSVNNLTVAYAARPSSVRIAEHPTIFSVQDETEGVKKGSPRSGWIKRVGSTLSFSNISRKSANDSPTSEEAANPTILALAAAATSAVTTATAAASSAAATAAMSEAEQRQDNLRAEDLLPPALDEKDVDLSLMFLPQMVVSCMAIWCCGCVMGLIGFVFSVIGSRRAVAERKGEAKKYEILSYVFSLIGFIGGFIVIIIFLVYAILSYNHALAANSVPVS